MLYITLALVAITIGSFIFSLPYILLGNGWMMLLNAVLFGISGLFMWICEEWYVSKR